MRYLLAHTIELVYYRSGYGAEGDPIEIALPGEGIDDILGTEDEKSLTLEALTLDYEGVSIHLQTCMEILQR